VDLSQPKGPAKKPKLVDLCRRKREEEIMAAMKRVREIEAMKKARRS